MSSRDRQLIVPRFGDEDVLELRPVPSRAPGPTEVVVETHYIGINFADILARRGYYKWAGAPPICPGFEASGIVIERGARATLPLGTRVIVFCRFGAYSERITCEEARLLPMPDAMSLQDGAALPAVYGTAYHALFEVLRLRRDDSLLVQAVAGGVGLAALQLAKHAGAVVYGTASSSEKLAFAREHGLDHAINYAEEDFEAAIMKLTQGRGVRFVLDSLGGEALRKGYRCLSSPGHALSIGAADIVPPPTLDLRAWWHVASAFVAGGVYHPFPLIERNRGISGMQILLLWDQVDYLRGLGERLLELHTAGIVRPFIHEVFPLERAGEAHTFMEARKSRGKLLLSTRHAA